MQKHHHRMRKGTAQVQNLPSASKPHTPHPLHHTPRRGGWSVLDSLIVAMAVAVVMVFSYAIFRPDHSGEWRQACDSNMRQLALATMQYLQDYQSRFPAVSLEVAQRNHRRRKASSPVTTAKIAKGGLAGPGGKPGVQVAISSVAEPAPVYGIGDATYGWADALLIYVHDRRAYHCPANPHATRLKDQNNPTLTGYTDYWYNRNLSLLDLETVTRPANILMLGEGNDGTDLTDARYCLAGLPPEWPINLQNPPFRHAGGALYAFADGHVKWLTPAKITTANGADATFSLN